MNRSSAFLAVILTVSAASVLAQTTDPQAGQRVTVPREERARLQKPPSVTPIVPEPSTSATPDGESQPMPEHIRSLVLADAARRAATSPEAVTVVDSRAVNWPDGSLGCPERGMTYPQLPVSGYRVVVNAKGRTYDYRVGMPVAATTGPQPSGAAVQLRLCDSSQGIRALEQPAPAPQPPR